MAFNHLSNFSSFVRLGIQAMRIESQSLVSQVVVVSTIPRSVFPLLKVSFHQKQGPPRDFEEQEESLFLPYPQPTPAQRLLVRVFKRLVLFLLRGVVGGVGAATRRTKPGRANGRGSFFDRCGGHSLPIIETGVTPLSILVHVAAPSI